MIRNSVLSKVSASASASGSTSARKVEHLVVGGEGEQLRVERRGAAAEKLVRVPQEAEARAAPSVIQLALGQHTCRSAVTDVLCM